MDIIYYRKLKEKNLRERIRTIISTVPNHIYIFIIRNITQESFRLFWDDVKFMFCLALPSLNCLLLYFLKKKKLLINID